MTRFRRRSAVVAAAGLRCLALAFASTLAASSARADGPVDAAADAYDRGVAAQTAGDQAAAAREFAHADALVPSDVALEAALDACDRAQGKEPVLCRELTERAQRSSSPHVGELARGLRAKLPPKPAPVKAPPKVEVVAPPPPPPPEPAGLSPWWTVAGAGLTAAAGVLAGVSWATASDKKDTFHANGCTETGSDACDSLASSGRGAVTRTNVFVITAGALAVGTAVVSVFFVKWSSTSRRVGVTSGAFVF